MTVGAHSRSLWCLDVIRSGLFIPRLREKRGEKTCRCCKLCHILCRERARCVLTETCMATTTTFFLGGAHCSVPFFSMKRVLAYVHK